MKRSETTPETVLKNRILNLELAPAALLDEVSLAAEFGVSRTPMRELIQRLAGQGYLVLERNRGAKVAPMDLIAMRTFFQTAPMVYSAVARLAASNAESEQIAELKRIQARFKRNGERGDANGMVRCNHEFHFLIGEMAANPYLMPSLSRLLIDHTRMSQMFYRPANALERKLVWQASEQHEQMIDAIENRDPERIVEITRQHWELSRNRLERFVRPDPLPVDTDPGMRAAG